MKPTPKEVLHALADGKWVQVDDEYFSLDLANGYLLRGTCPGPCKQVSDCTWSRTRWLRIDFVMLGATRIIEPETATELAESNFGTLKPEPVSDDTMILAVKDHMGRQKAKDELLREAVNILRNLCRSHDLGGSEQVLTELRDKAFPEES